MNSRGKNHWLMALALVLVGCPEDPVASYRTDNPNLDVQLLFAHDGCKVYRFRDAGRSHYFVRCKGSDGQAVIESHAQTQTTGKVQVIEEWSQQTPTVEESPK